MTATHHKGLLKLELGGDGNREGILKGSAISGTYVIHLLQMLEESNSSVTFCDRVE
jgi:hypothetical protein